MDNFTVHTGMSAKDSPSPDPELRVGNTVKLKKPYRASGVRPDGTHDKPRLFTWGIIAEQDQRNAFGHPRLGLHLWDDEGVMYRIGLWPATVDFCASEFVLYMIPGTPYRRFSEGFDLYPTCLACGGNTTNCFASDACRACNGWGHVPEMRRLPKEDHE